MTKKKFGVSGGCQLSAEQFNTWYPVGTPVRFYPVAGSELHEDTKTRAAAFETGSGAPIVHVDGRAAAVALDHLVLLLSLLALLAGCAGDPASSDRAGWDSVPNGDEQQGGGQPGRVTDPVGMAGAGEYGEPGKARLAPRDVSDASSSAGDAGSRPWWLTHSDGGTDEPTDAGAAPPDGGSGSGQADSGSDPVDDAGTPADPIDAGQPSPDAGQSGTDAATGAALVLCRIAGGQQLAGQLLGCDAGVLLPGAVVRWPSPAPVGQPSYSCASSAATPCVAGESCAVIYNGTTQHGVCE
jgi:hypothetical protein